jgi:hypothetical protein
MELVNDVLDVQERTGSVPAATGRLPVDEFMKFIEETRAQPAFRASQDTAADYYDSNQMQAETLQALDAMGFGSLMTNLIKPSVDTVLGIEAKNRTNFRCVADDDQDQDVAEAMSVKLAEAERESRADRACADAYAGQVKVGLGWVHVTRNPDPFMYQYKSESVHRREMFWDWSARDPYLDDARYVLRQKWYPTDQVKAALPQHTALIDASSGGWQPDWIQRARESVHLMSALDQENRMSVTSWEWRNIDSRRVALQECWYAVYVRGLILRLPNGKTVEFNNKNVVHRAAVGSGSVKPEVAVYRKLRCSLWYGPHLLQDYDAGSNKLPYVPFWGYREDLTGVPYGVIKSMIPLQDEVNARRRKLMWLLSSKRVMVDADALDGRMNDFAALVEEVSRPDSMVVLNPMRTNKQNAITIETDLQLASQQFEILQEAKEGIQAAAGIFNSIMGKTDGAKSGVAVNALVEQSSNTLGEINDNYKFGRARVGELLVRLIRQDMSGQQVDVVTGMDTSKRKTVSLNKRAVDDVTGMQYFENDTDKANFKVALEEVPSTPAYRQELLMTIGETLKSLPPQLQAAMAPYYIEATDLPRRQEMAKSMRAMMGMDDNSDPAVAQLKQQLDLVHQQSEAAMQKYEQAIQEINQKYQASNADVQALKLQLANRSEEFKVKGRELDVKSQEIAAKVQELAAQRDGSGAEAEGRRTELALQASKASNDAQAKAREHDLRRTELEHTMLQNARVDPREELARMVEQQVTPLKTKLETTIENLQRDAREKAAMEKGMKAGQKMGADGEDPAMAALERKKLIADTDLVKANTTLVLEQAEQLENGEDESTEDPANDTDPNEERRTEEMHQAKLEQVKTQTKAVDTKAKVTVDQSKAKVANDAAKTKAATAPAPAPAPAAAAPAIEIVKKNGQIVGANINGKPALKVTRGAKGEMVITRVGGK